MRLNHDKCGGTVDVGWQRTDSVEQPRLENLAVARFAQHRGDPPELGAQPTRPLRFNEWAERLQHAA